MSDEKSRDEVRRLRQHGSEGALEAMGELAAPPNEVRGARGILRCASCGYAVVVHAAPEVCPMCQGDVWETSDHGRSGERA
jgi:rubrerythrin